MNTPLNYSHLKLGIIGGGQLGKIMSQKAKKMGFHVTVLDPTPNCPAGQVSDAQIVGGFYDQAKLVELIRTCDVTTFELENVDVEALKPLFDQGYAIYPSPYTIALIQNKYEQKKFLDSKGIPVPTYKDVKTPSCLESLGFPVVQKAKKGGYDGRGVMVLKSKEDLKNAIQGESFLEEMVNIDKELAIIVARNLQGEVACYPVVEMLFDERVNICDSVMAPARIAPALAQEVKDIAIACVESFEGVGIFGVEMFLTKEGKILVNEIAPRPHNSAHYTIESCVTSQFEQIVRAVTGLPLGSTELIIPSVMVNLLGEEGFEGEPLLEGLPEILALDKLSFHFYGKSHTKPFRKMGHITVLDHNLDLALARALKAKDIFKVKGTKPL